MLPFVVNIYFSLSVSVVALGLKAQEIQFKALPAAESRANWDNWLANYCCSKTETVIRVFSLSETFILSVIKQIYYWMMSRHSMYPITSVIFRGCEVRAKSRAVWLFSFHFIRAVRSASNRAIFSLSDLLKKSLN